MSQKKSSDLSHIRSYLANERTILAYIRTALVLLATGIAFQELFHRPFIYLIGNILVFFAGVTFVVGCISFLKMNIRIKKEY